jgi:hypothetical protein
MKIQPNVGPHLRYPFDLLPGGWLVIDGPAAERQEMVDGLREAAYSDDPLWRVPPIFTGRPNLQEADADMTHHKQVVRRARERGKFVIADGSWLGRLAEDCDLSGNDLDAILANRKEQVWGQDQPSLAVILLDGTASTAKFWMRAIDHHPHRLLLPSRMDRGERITALFAEMRHLRLNGGLA